MKLDEMTYTPGSGLDLQRAPFTTRVLLADGGIYDNLGIETVWKRYRTVLVSDGGGHVRAEPVPATDLLRRIPRITNIIDSQLRAVRRRQVISALSLGVRDGAYWGIRSHIGDYGLPDALPCDPVMTMALADTPARLAAMPAALQERLINWGYAVCDAAVRTRLDATLPAPGGFPYPASGVG